MRMKKDNSINRRGFLKASGLAVTGTLATPLMSSAANLTKQSLQVWSCGGLAEAMMPANAEFEKATGASIAYTGAFAAALGKSLLANATTEVFAPRVLDLAKKLKSEGRMLWFKPLCFTKYVLITPRGNPAGIQGIADLANPGVRVILTPGASAPGGEASLIILEKAGVLEQAKKNAVFNGDCVQTAMAQLVAGKGDVAVMELRLIYIPEFKGRAETIDIPEQFIPGKPVPFTVGMMKWAQNRELAERYIEFILSEQGQIWFERAGFIPALSDEGRRLTQQYGVIDA
jgi:molybdate transport system substrate-binding protein